ncbi:TPA: hypothetical protein DDW35_01205, partial [Candidatus Sumerlaeota bacterium]|nr:hypothetical protein [Candidatus Sumerlaeota bacterium]
MIFFASKRHYVQRGKKGIILLSVSWCVLILSLALLSQFRSIEFNFQREKLSKDDFRLRMAAKSILNQIEASMQQEVEGGKNEYDAYSDAWGWQCIQDAFGNDIRVAYPNIEFNVSIEDEDSKIPLRTADISQIAQALEYLGWPKLEATDLATAMKELTSKASESAGAEGGQSAPSSQEGQSSQGKEKQSYMDPRYLLSLSSLTPEILFGNDVDFSGQQTPGILRCFTLVGDGKINPNLAPLEVLRTVSGVSRVIAEEIISKRTGPDDIAGTDDDFIFGKMENLQNLGSVSKFHGFEYAKMAKYMRVTSQHFNIKIFAVNKDSGLVFRIQTCIERTDKGDIRTLSWIEDNG